jgi:hypothetical protein
MSDDDAPREKPADEADLLVDDDDPVPMPKWVPLLIGAVLVAMAALAVYTGAVPRPSTLVRMVRPRRVPMTANAGPPGEPQAGASRSYPGESGDNTPEANPPVPGGKSRVMIEGSGNAVAANLRMWARRGFLLRVTPDDALVYVNDVMVGQAHQFATTDEVYDFPAAGSYTIRLMAPGYHDQSFTVTAAENANQEIAIITAQLHEEGPGKK